MRILYFVFVVGVLVANVYCDNGDTTTDAASSSTAVPTDSPSSEPQTTQTAATDSAGSTSTAGAATTQGDSSTGTPGTAGSTVTPDAGQTTQAVSANTQPSGGSTQKPGGASSAAPASPKSTQPAATIVTTLLPVTVSYAAFTYKCVPTAQCVYTFNAPINSQSFLATEETNIQSNQGEVSSLQTQIKNYKTNVSLVYDPENTKVQALQQQLNDAQIALNWLQANITAIKASQQQANANLVVLNQYIGGLLANKNTCYYQGCMKPTPAPTTTPTTTRAPSTVTSACQAGYCQNVTNGDITAYPVCTMADKGPFCACTGNLDGYQQCQQSDCSGAGNLPLPGRVGPFWSPGYIAPDNITAYPANSTCKWSFSGNYQANSTSYNNIIDPSSSLILDYGSGTIQITNWRKLNSALQNYDKFTITLTTGSIVDPKYYFAWTMYDNTPTAKPF